MTIVDLISRLSEITGWNLTRMHQEAGISDRTSYARRTNAAPPKDSFDLKLLRLACREGAVADVLAILFGDRPIPTALLAVALFPDITALELHGILSPDTAAASDHPLSAERIMTIMAAFRPLPPTHPDPRGTMKGSS